MQLFLTLAGLYGLLYGLYFVITSLGGFIAKKTYTLQEAGDTARVAAIIPARNEENVVGALVESLKAQDYPQDLLDIYVVINNCTDSTEAQARAAGARILYCSEPVRRKGDVLRQAFGQLTAMGRYDAYCIFDADNLVHPKFVHQVSNAFHAGYDVAQGFRDSKNPFDSWLAGSTSIFYWFMSRVFNESRARLGLSCHLNGTGFMVTDRYICRVGFDTHTLTEDLEFTGLCALNDCRIGWMPEARVYDEQPIHFVDSAVQRRRWTSGSLQCMRRYCLKLMKKATPCSVDIGMLFLGNSLHYIGILSGICSVLLYGPLALEHLKLSAALALAYVVGYWLLCMLGAVVMLRMEGRLNGRSVPTILLFPLFLASWLPINLYAALTPPPRWRAVRHVGNVAPDDQPEKSTSTSRPH